MKIVEPGAKILACTPDALTLLERAGRICYKSEELITEDSSEKFVRMILDRGHESVLEHASATFVVVCDRGVSHEIVRHRLASYSQESTRYCNYAKKTGEGEKNEGGMKFIEPEIPSQYAKDIWHKQMREIEQNYNSMIDDGITPQIARSILPNSLKTEIVITMNFRAWRHFFKLRWSKKAHPQIRPIAREIMMWFKENYPVIVEDIILEMGE